MDFLPPEIKLIIFNQLSISESIKCRQVCKGWLTVIDGLRYKILIFQVAKYKRSKGGAFNRYIDLWILNSKKFFRSVTIDPKFSSIKVMNAIGYLSGVENLEVFINHFHGLEELNLEYAPKVVKLVLNLKFLKKIKFDYPPDEVKLETPSLTHLMTMQLSNFKICYPEQIKCLGVRNASSLTKFTNLEILFIIDHFIKRNNISQLSADLLHQLPQLKRVYAGWNHFSKRLGQIPIDRNSDLQVYYYGFRINPDIFGNFDWTNLKNLNHLNKDCEWTSFMAKNYSTSIDDNPYPFYLDYTRFLDEFEQNIPNDFHKKISKIHSIRIRNLNDEVTILKFLDSNKPRLLFIETPTLSRSFLEQLSKFSSIMYLGIKIDEWPSFLDNFNFDFKNKIDLEIKIRCSLKSLRPMIELFERMISTQLLHLCILCDEFKFYLVDYTLEMPIRLSITYTLNGEVISTGYAMESLDFCFYLDRQVPSIVELKDKLRLFFIVEECESQRRITEKVIRKLYQNPTISIKF